MSQQREGLERQMNFLLDSMDLISGVPLGGPRFPEKDIIQIQNPTFHNIKIDKSTIGVLNTGAIQNVDSAVSVLHDLGDKNLSEAILKLTQAILSNTEIHKDTKNDAIEILSLLADEATAPKGKRRSKAMKPLLSQLSNLVSIGSGLSTIWERVKPILESAFQ